MTKRRKKSLTRQILPGMLAAGVLWGGFAAQAEAAGTYHLKEATRDGDEIACNNTVTEAKNLGAPEFNGAEYAVGYVSGGIVANANGNKLTLNTGAKFTHASDANGLYYFSIYGGKVGNASSNANYNTVIVNGGDYEIEYLAGGYGQTASHNTVTINDTTGTFTAKEAIMGGGGTGNSDYNTVNINGGTFSKNIKIAGGGFSGNSHNNTVNINGGTFSDNTKIYGGSANAGTASGNTVNITGGTFDFGTEIIGGYSASGNADNNTVTISGGSFDGSAKLFGGNNAGNNNTLNLKIKGLTVYSVDGFQNLNFYIPKTAKANDIMILSILVDTLNSYKEDSYAAIGRAA